jgi:ribonuclease Z
MRITFLGTGAGMPSRERNVSSVAVRLSDSSETWLFDCGEGTQHRIIESDVRLGQITRIFLSHIHGDHIFGLPGLISTCWMNTPEKMLDIYGPREVITYLEESLLRPSAGFSIPARLTTLEPGASVAFGDLTVTTAPLEHRVETLGYRIDEKQKEGRFDAERAEALGVPSGPLFGRLKRGETITLPDGQTVDGRELCGEPRPGGSVVYCCDTIYTEAAVELARGASLLIHEATFARAEQHLAEQRLHSTTEMAARVAAEAAVERLFMTHISPRYALAAAGDLVAEARVVFEASDIAGDLLSVEV